MRSRFIFFMLLARQWTIRYALHAETIIALSYVVTLFSVAATYDYPLFSLDARTLLAIAYATLGLQLVNVLLHIFMYITRSKK